MQQQLRDIQRRVLGAEHPNTLATTGHLVVCLISQGKHTEAEPIRRELLEAQQRVLGMAHPDTLATASSLSELLSSRC